MKINCAHDELIEIHKLQPNPHNPNKHPKKQIDLLAKIIDYQGQRSPIVVSNRSGFITKGHGRLEAIKKLGWVEAAVDFQDYDSEAQEYADMIADNKISELAQHDNTKMIDDLTKFEWVEDFDLSLLGIPEFKIPDPEEIRSSTDQLTEDEKSYAEKFNQDSLEDKLINLGQGKYSKVSSEDFEYLNQFQWHLHKTIRDGAREIYYAFTSSVPESNHERLRIGMHRVVYARANQDPMFLIRGIKYIDHVNFDGLDNTRPNLRECSNSENQTHKRVGKNSITGLKGVGLNKKTGKYYFRFTDKNRKRIFKGNIATAEEAVELYNKLIQEHHGDMSVPNTIKEESPHV